MTQLDQAVGDSLADGQPDTASDSVPRGRASGVFGIVFSRSAGRTAVWLLAAVCVLHIGLRTMPWRYDWLWAITQYAYVTVLLAPLVAGVAAWEASNYSGATDSITSAGGARRTLWMTTLGVWTWSLGAACVGLGAVVVITVSSGVGTPSPTQMAALAPAAMMLGTGAAFGTMLGWWMRHWSAAVVACGVLFGLILGAFVSENEILARTGGATADLTGLVINDGWVLRQLIWFPIAAALLIEIAARRPTSAFGFDSVVSVGLIASLAGAGWLVASGSQLMFSPTFVELQCLGTPAVCVTSPYVDREPAIREGLEPAAAAWALLESRAPDQFSQAGSGEPGLFTVALPGPVIRGEVPFSTDLFLNGYESALRGDCYDSFIAPDPTLFTSETSLRGWLLFTAGRSSLRQQPWAEMSQQRQVEWARSTLADIAEACRAPA